MRTQPLLPSSRRHQRGAALLTAMIIVTLVATVSAAMVWQQWRAVQVESAERARAQSAWILSGALDFAKLILREDAKGSSQVTALTEPWATPLAESRLSTFLSMDKGSTDDGPEAFLSGSISDAQARYNLMNLVMQDGKLDPDEVAALQRLCEAVGIEIGIATRIGEGIVAAKAGTSANAPLLPATVAQLTWLGVDESSVKALSPYVVLLPTVTAVNVNTASAEVLTAVVPGLDGSTAERLIQVRQRTPFKTREAFNSQLTAPVPATTKLGFRSDYFEVHGRLRLADHVLVERSLLYRQPDRSSKVLDRQRVSTLEQAGG